MYLMKRIEIQQIDRDRWLVQWYTNASRINQRDLHNHYEMQVFVNKLLDEDGEW